MNEIRFITFIRGALAESATRLPPQVAQRLDQAREAALAQARMDPPCIDAPRTGAAHSAGIRSAARRGSTPHPGRRLLRGLALIGAPLAILVAGFLLLGEIESERYAVETAEVEAAVLADVVPIDAYADRGFGVYLVNSRQ